MAESSAQVAAIPPSSTTHAALKPEAAKEPDPSTKFKGTGVIFRAKVIGIEDVSESRGDKMCQDAILKLKGNVKVSGQHKQKIVINISMSGIKLIDVMTAQVLHEHRVDRISFIARDLTDRRAFGYIVGDDAGNHRFYAIKTAKVAEQVVLVLRDLFQVVYDMKQKEVETAKAQSEDAGKQPTQPATATAQMVQTSEGIHNLEQQLENMQQMSDMDAFKTSWPANSPATPDTSNTGTDSDMFGMGNLSDISSLSSDFSLQSSTNDPAKLKDSKNRSQSDAQFQEFRRSSSQKSAASWNGTSNTSGFAQRRYASLTVSRAKELEGTLPELTTITSLPDTNPGSPKMNNNAASANKIEPSPQSNSSCSSPDKQPDKRSLDTLSVGDGMSTKSPESDVAENSFFDEVMAATGIPTDRLTDVDNEGKTKVKTSNDARGSMSSLSSSGSKRSLKSRSINNLFFGKSEKNKSSVNRKNKVSRQSSSSSVTSVTERPTINTIETISDTRSVGPPDNCSAVTSSASSLRSHRKSSSSSVTSFDRASREHPISHSSPKMETPPNKPRSVRIRPSAAVARARPRAAQPQTTSANPKNPPMFKTKSTVPNDAKNRNSESNEPGPDQTVDSPASVRSCQSAVSKEDQAHSLSSTDKIDRAESVGDTWACFDENSSHKPPDKSKDPFAVADWETRSTTSKKQQSDAWTAFGVKNKNEEGFKRKTDDTAFSSEQDNPFANSEFDDRFASEPSAKEAWNAFKIDTDEKSNPQDKNNFSSADSPEDPFSNDVDSNFDREDFESCDPFADTNTNLSEDPFQNFEAVFGISANANNEENDIKEEKKNAEPQETQRSSSTEFACDDPIPSLDVFDNKVEDSKLSRGDEKSREEAAFDVNDDKSVDPFENFEAAFSNSSDSKPNIEDVRECDEKSTKLDENQFSSKTAAFSQDPFCDFESVFNVAFTERTTEKNDQSGNENLMPKDNVLDIFDNLSQLSPTVSSSNQVCTAPKVPSRTSSVRSRKSSVYSNASSKRTSSPNPKKVQSMEDSSWATFPPDQGDVFDNVPFKCDMPTNNSLVSSFFPPTSPPPPLPPRPPKRISIPSEDEASHPPAIPPPPIPVRPRRASRIIEESSSSSESDLEAPIAPPSFLPPQLPADLVNDGQSNSPTTECIFPNHETFEASFSTSFHPSVTSSLAENDDVSRCLSTYSCIPPAIPKRSLSKRTSPIYENNIRSQGDSSQQSSMNRNASYGDDLAGFSMEALQPAANGGAKLTKDQILAGFGQGQPSSEMYQQPQVAANPFSAPQATYSSQPMSATFGAPFGASQRMPMAGFPMGPRPAVPVRSGAMRPPIAFQAQAAPEQSLFGDAQAPTSEILAPVNMQPDLTNGLAKEEKPKYDPFGSLLPDLGKTDKKDMFKNFKMAKPPSKSDLQQENVYANTPNVIPSNHQDAGDPFASMTNSNFGNALNADNHQQPQQANNFDLFG